MYASLESGLQGPMSVADQADIAQLVASPIRERVQSPRLH